MNRLGVLGQRDGVLGVLPPLGPPSGELGLLAQQPAAVPVLDIDVDTHDGRSALDRAGALALGVSGELHR